MQNHQGYDEQEEDDEEVDPRASLINNSAATREIMMRMLSPQLQQPRPGLSPVEGNYRGHRGDDYRIAHAAGASSGSSQRLPMMSGPMGGHSAPSFATLHMADSQGNADEAMLSRMMLLRQQQMATVESNRMLSMYRGGMGQEMGNQQLGSDGPLRAYTYSQQRGMGVATGHDTHAGAATQSMLHQSSFGSDRRGAPLPGGPLDGGSLPDPRSPSQWRNFPPPNLINGPYQHDQQRLDIPQMPLYDMMWRQAMASTADQKQSYDDPRLVHMRAMMDARKLDGDDSAPPQKKKRRASRKKPADMPRRPLSAYNLFFSEERERILAEISGEQANTSSEPEIPSEPDFVSSEAAQKPEGDYSDAQKPSIKALLRPLVPSEKKRRPHRKTHGKISFKELAKMVGQRWKGLPVDRKSYYQDLASEDMKRQKIAMEEYYKKQKELHEGNATEASARLKSEDGD